MKPFSKDKKTKKAKQKSLGLDTGLDMQMSGFFYRFRKMERLLEVSPFWRSSFVWFVFCLDIFIHILIALYFVEKLADLPARIPFLFIYPEGDLQLISPIELWYFFAGSVALSLINIYWGARLYASDRHEAKFLLLINVLKSILFVGLIYKLFVNWL